MSHSHAWYSGGPKRIAPLLVGPVGMELAGVAAAILAAPQGPGLFGGTSASRKRFAAGLSSAELEVHRIGLRAELDAVRGEQVDREALGNQREEEEEEEEIKMYSREKFNDEKFGQENN
ncbi:hypothetical protein ACHAO1_002698 [Botrytis cinerea]